MKKIIFTLWIVPSVLIMFAAFGANKKQIRRNPQVKPQLTNIVDGSVETEDDRNSRMTETFVAQGGHPIKNSGLILSTNNDDSWNIAARDLHEAINEPEEKTMQLNLLSRTEPSWRATMNHFKNAVLSRIRRAYYYLFSRKAAIDNTEGLRTESKYIISYDDPVTGKRVTRNITEIQDAAGNTIMKEGL